MIQAQRAGRSVVVLGGISVAALILGAGCNLKFPGPRFDFNTPDAAILGNFAGSGSLGYLNGAAGQNSNQSSVAHPPTVIVSLMSVNGVAPAAPCPAGHMATDGTCRLRSGVAAQCPQGASMCSTGKCCAAGFTCGSGGACERAPGGASLAQPALCVSGQVVTSEGSDCPALNESNAAELRARCCPVGATLHCTQEGNAASAVCVTQAFPGQTCPFHYRQLVDSVTSMSACCPEASGTIQLSNGECLYGDAIAPQCNGSVDPATGTCCAGSFDDAGRCCAVGHQACAQGCCELGESCDEGSGKCIADEKAITPVCPTESPVDCSSLGGQCCPGNTQCQPDGSCSCPANTPVDCGGFCAISTTQCSCPSDHPEACGAQCCLHGGCGSANGASGAANTCGCPADTAACGNSCCPSGSSCVDGQCLSCAGDAPTLCGSTCCALGQTCMAGQCVGGACGGDTPLQCGSTCCHAGDACNSGVCVAQPGSSQAGRGDSAGPDAGVGIASGSGSTPGLGSGESCQPIPVGCTGCTVNACASASSDGACHSWFAASDGAKFECKSCGDCMTAASAAVVHCCPLHL